MAWNPNECVNQFNTNAGQILIQGFSADAFRKAVQFIYAHKEQLDALADTVAGIEAASGVTTANSPATGEFAKFVDANNIEGRTISETKTDLSIQNVDNTSDVDKPVSTAQQTALDGKAASSHTHSIANVTSLQASLDGKAPTTHSHSISDITDLVTQLAGKQATLVSGTTIKTVNGNDITGAGNVAIGASLSSLNGTLTSADVTMTNANQFYTGTSVDLTAGTWLIVAHITLGRANTTLIRYTARLRNTTDSVNLATSQMTQPSQNPHYVNITLTALVTVASNKTVELQAAATTGACLIKRIVADNAVANDFTATQINAVKIA